MTRRIAIVGGGVAGVTAAFALTDPENQRDGESCEVTLFQKGFRLGGKGASGRNAAQAERIEEHGLHLWMGFYENAFEQMTRCLEEIEPLRPPGYRITRIDQAFERANRIGLMERVPGRDYELWWADFPDTGTLPWQPPDDVLEGRHYVELALRLALLLMVSARRGRPLSPELEFADLDPIESLPGAAGALLLRMRELLEDLVFVAAKLFDQGLDVVRAALTVSENATLRQLRSGLECASKWIDRFTEQISADADDDDLRRTWEMIELVLTCVRGILVDRLLVPADFDRVDDEDLREWLARHGASDRARECAVLRGIYDLTFSYDAGQPDRPRFAAGTALRNMIRMFFTYHGALFWRMQGGMGDVVFEPFYQALRARGVRFRFFHELERVALDPHRDAVRELVFQQQVELVDEDGRETLDYDPLVTVELHDGSTLRCWPSEPRYAALRGGAAEHAGKDFESHWERHRCCERHFTVGPGEDFDHVVLATGIGAAPYLCEELLARSARWRDMVAHIGTVETNACQLWLRPEMREIGWTHRVAIALTGYLEPLCTWADMRHLHAFEPWPEEDPPGALAYFCHVLPDRDPPPQRDENDYPKTRQAFAQRQMEQFFDRDIGRLWPGAVRRYPDRFDWDLLVSRDPGRPGTLDGQWVRVNVNPSDRYVQALPGSTRYRLRAGESGFDGLILAGDWTRSGLDTGCVESAVLSGLRACQAILGAPGDDRIRGSMLV